MRHFPNCLGYCFLHRLIMAENEEMSPLEIKVARQIEVILILKLTIEFCESQLNSALTMFLTPMSSTTLGITIFRETSFSKNNCNLMMAGWLWRQCLNSTGLLYFSLGFKCCKTIATHILCLKFEHRYPVNMLTPDI